MVRSSAKKRGTPAAAVIAGGVNGRASAEAANLHLIGDCTLGDIVELADNASYGGTQSPSTLPALTIAKVSAHTVDGWTMVTVGRLDAFIPTSTLVRVVKAYRAREVMGATAEVDPLLTRSAS